MIMWPNIVTSLETTNLPPETICIRKKGQKVCLDWKKRTGTGVWNSSPETFFPESEETVTYECVTDSYFGPKHKLVHKWYLGGKLFLE